jgi:hypothetical protein
MALKILRWIGIVASLLLILSCFMPWAYYADVQQNFTGFYSYNNNYGKPGKFLTILAMLSLLFIFLPKIWAKRTNLFICALAIGYSIKSFVLFSSCYNAYCPQKLPWIYVMLISTFVMQLAAIFPDMKLPVIKKEN